MTLLAVHARCVCCGLTEACGGGGDFATEALSTAGSPLALFTGGGALILMTGWGLALRAGCSLASDSGGALFAVNICAVLVTTLAEALARRTACLFASNLLSAVSLASLAIVSTDGGGGFGVEICLAGGLAAGLAPGGAALNGLAAAGGATCKDAPLSMIYCRYLLWLR